MRSATILILLGVILLAGGLMALFNPFAASLAVTTLVGAFLVVSGAVQLWVALADPFVRHRVWTGIVALIGLVAGVSLLANPLQGVISLTLLVGVLFLFTGGIRLAMAFSVRESPLFWVLLIAGLASAIIGIMVFSNILAAATTLLGLLLGLQLLVDGIALVSLGLLARSLD
jgi:uncharacterized membrane protein HdeD (DUF308 family)